MGTEKTGVVFQALQCAPVVDLGALSVTFVTKKRGLGALGV